ncbi:MAG: hypothetical protein HXY38_08465 [Chloroflexi bacterium]|nr:hypothetical protein [Chloroflexota bacterium]
MRHRGSGKVSRALKTSPQISPATVCEEILPVMSNPAQITTGSASQTREACQTLR